MLQTASQFFQVITGILGSVVFLAGTIALFRGGWRSFKKISSLADKGNAFIDNIFPDMLDHFCNTERVPRDIMPRWTTIMSGLTKSQSPLAISKKGEYLIKKSEIDQVFNINKENYALRIKETIKDKTTKYQLETECIRLISLLFRSDDSSLDPVKNFMYENPNKLKSVDIYILMGLLLRDHIIKEHPDWIK